MKILMLAPTPYFSDRGCHVRIYEEARALLSLGHQVHIVTYHLGRDVGDIPVSRIPSIPWYRKTSAGPSWHKPYLDLLLLFRALRVSRTYRPDVIHAHLHEGAFLAALGKRFFRAPVLFDCQGSLTGELLDHRFMRRGGLLHRIFAALERWITRRADCVVTSSTQTAEAIREEFPDLAERVVPLIDAVDTEAFSVEARDQKLFEQLQLPEGKRILVYLGAMTEYQGVGMFLEGLRCLKASRDDFHALLMGYPEAEYRERARQMGLDDVTTFTGKIDYAQAARYLNLGDVAVSLKTSATEANGKLLNYMACGLPCVVLDTPVNRELLGREGVYVAERSANAFALALEALLEQPERLAERAAGARTHAVEAHSWAVRGRVLEDLFRQMR